MAVQTATKALRLLKDNIQALLHHRKEDQVSLAQWCGHSKAWINKFLNEDDAEIQLKDLDRIGDFFGVAAYQLFQPGINRVTERRRGERRANDERRIGAAGRMAGRLQTEVNKLSRLARQGDHDLSDLSPAAIALIEEYERKFLALQTREASNPRRQVASPGRKVAGAPKARGSRRGSHSETTE